MSEKNIYDLLIVGSGPAGLTASIYASRFKIANKVIGGELGGLVFEAHKICNFPSETEISGMELVDKMKRQAESLGEQILLDKVIDIRRESAGHFTVTTEAGQELFAKTVLLATGTRHRKLNLDREKDLLGRGISYCATCDAMFYKDKTVAVVGGGNSAHTASLYLAEIATKVYQIYRGSELKGETAWIDQLQDNPKVEIIFNNEITSLQGTDRLEAITLSQSHNNQSELAVDGLFIEVGTLPDKFFSDMLSIATNEQGYIKVTPDQATSLAGVWAAGDITDNSNNFRQIITAASEGAVAVESIFKFLKSQ